MSAERSEPATPRRRRKAREEGQVARSAELVSTAILLGALLAVPSLAPQFASHLTRFLHAALGAAATGGEGQAGLENLGRAALRLTVVAAAPWLALAVLGAVVGNVAQVGWFFAPAVLRPRLSRTDPIAGAKRLFSARGAVELVKGLAKIVCVAGVGALYLSERWPELAELSATRPDAIAPHVGRLAHEMAIRMTATLALLAALDYAYQRWQFERSLRMTRQEIKEELRETEGRPEVRAQIRARQRQMARRRMMAAIPGASVVIVNPTHYAVALKYALGQDGAPKVVAKGRDRVALRIRDIAADHGVPIVPNAPLARSLHDMVEIDQEIPAALFRAVAEVLALVWRLDRQLRRTG